MLKSSLYFFVAAFLASSAFADKGSLKNFKVIDRTKLEYVVKEVMKDKEVSGVRYDIKIKKKGGRKDTTEITQIPTFQFVGSPSDSTRKAFSEKYSKRIADSTAIALELDGYKNLNFNRIDGNYTVIISEKKIDSHETVQARYFKEWLIEYKNGEVSKSEAFYKEAFPIKK